MKYTSSVTPARTSTDCSSRRMTYVPIRYDREHSGARLGLAHPDALVSARSPDDALAHSIEVHLVPDVHPRRIVVRNRPHAIHQVLPLLVVERRLKLVEQLVVLRALPVGGVQREVFVDVVELLLAVE